MPFCHADTGKEGGKEREGVNVVIKDSILLLVCVGLSREFSGLEQTSVTISTQHGQY